MNLPADDELDLERMIDGELPFAEQRGLLDRLDIMPDGWRRLALGLLEEQAFRRECQLITSEVPVEPPVVAISSAPVAPVRSRGWTRQAVVMALCLGCLAAGMQIEQVLGRNRAFDPAPQANSTAVSDDRDTAVVAPTDESQPILPEFVAQNADEPALDQNVAARETLKVVFADWPTPIEVPVLETSDDEAGDLLGRSLVSEEMRKEWASAGYLIYENRKYVPVPLGDGRQGIAPISDIVVEYVGTEEYQ